MSMKKNGLSESKTVSERWTLLDKFIFGIDMLFLCLYTYILCTQTFVLHPELCVQLPQMVESSHDFIERMFNLQIIENAMYRPRVLCFLFEYIDCNFALLLSGITNKLVFILSFLSGYVYVFALYLLFKRMLPMLKAPVILLLSILPIFTHSWIASNVILCRSSKLYTPIFAVGLYYLFLTYRDVRKINFPQIFIYALVMFVGMLLDEQVIFFILCMFGIQLIIDIYRNLKVVEKESSIEFASITPANFSPTVYAGLFAGVMYIVWYKFIGRLLFSMYTPVQLLPHMHQFSQPLERFSVIMVLNSLSVWFETNSAFFLPLPFSIILVLSLILIFVSVKANAKKFELVSLFIGSFTLVYICCASHPRIFVLKDLPHSSYMLTVSLMCYIVLINLLATFANYRTLVKGCVVFVLLGMLLVNISNVDEYISTHFGYYGHLQLINGQLSILEKCGIRDYYLSTFDFRKPSRIFYQ